MLTASVALWCHGATIMLRSRERIPGRAKSYWIFQFIFSPGLVPDMAIGSPPSTLWDGTYAAKCGCPGSYQDTSVYPFWEKDVRLCMYVTPNIHIHSPDPTLRTIKSCVMGIRNYERLFGLTNTQTQHKYLWAAQTFLSERR